jgi:demethylmenaquinone methyltransferase / 2-methoxy-6-polyprenyl-1,4-benzoquinol methylase
MPLPPEQQDRRLMQEMFDTISPRYDFITRAFSYGMDPRWKRKAVELAHLPENAVVLDLACGTADFSRLVTQVRPNARVVLLDLAFAMLERARASGFANSVCGDGLRLPFPDNSFDAIFVGYGLRNFPGLEAALAEIRRVLKPGGQLVSLDFFLPSNALLKAVFLGYLYIQGAFWGLVLHGRPRIYTSIPDSLKSFVAQPAYTGLLGRQGFNPVSGQSFILGGIGLHWATKKR